MNGLTVCACAACSQKGVLREEVVKHSELHSKARGTIARIANIANNRHERNKSVKCASLIVLFCVAAQMHPVISLHL